MVASTQKGSRVGQGEGTVLEGRDWAEAPDLRRRAERGEVERLLELARHLAPEDESLVRSYFVGGQSVVEIARLTGVCPRALRRRLRRLVVRLSSPIFKFVTLQREGWPRTRRRVATACVLRGMTLRDASTSLGISFHAVRRHHDTIRALFETERDHA